MTAAMNALVLLWTLVSTDMSRWRGGRVSPQGGYKVAAVVRKQAWHHEDLQTQTTSLWEPNPPSHHEGEGEPA